MNQLLNKEKINLYLNYIFILYTGTFLIDNGLSRILIGLSSILWILEGRLKDKLSSILKDKILLSYILLILSFFVSVFFSDNITNGFWDSKYKTGYDFLLAKPVIYSLMMFFIFTSLKKEFFKYLLIAFIFQVTFMCLHINGVMYFDIFSGKVDSSRFIYLNRIYLSIVLAISIFTSIYLYKLHENKQIKFFYLILMSYFIFNLFMLPGRTGQISFFIILFVCSFSFLNGYSIYRRLVILLIVFFSLVSIFIFAYSYSKNFQERLNLMESDIEKIDKNNYNSSIGVRILFNKISFSILTKDVNTFIFGLGMGNSKEIYHEYIDKEYNNIAFMKKYSHIHNQYFQTWVDGGIVSLILLILLYVFLIKLKTGFYTKVYIISITLVFILYGFSGGIFYRAKMIELFTLFIACSILLNKFKENIIYKVPSFKK